MSKQVNLRLDEDLLAGVDRVRGDVPRQRWIRRLCADAVVAHDGLDPGVDGPPAAAGRLGREAPDPGVRAVPRPEAPKTAKPAAEVPLPKIAPRHWG